MSKNYCLMKSELDFWTINQQEKVVSKGASWDGIRNYQATKNLIKDTVFVSIKICKKS